MDLQVERGLELRALRFLHIFFPIIAAIYYVVASFVESIPSSKKSTPTAQQPKRLRLALGCIMLLVLATYVGDSMVLISASVSKTIVSPPQDSIIFALASSLFWFRTILAYIDSKKPPGYPLYGSWLLYFVFELGLLLLYLRLNLPRTKLSLATTISQAIRLSILASLPCTIFSSRLYTAKRVGDDEENTPLLSDSANEIQGDGTENAYGSCNSRSASTETTGPQKSKIDPKRNDMGKGVFERRKLNLWAFITNLRAILPFYWPSGKPMLQLGYLGVAVCLVFQRIMNIVIPLQIGLITNILSKNDGIFPWKEISLFIALRLLDSSCGLTTIRKLLWIPLEEYSYKNLSLAAYNQIMSLSSDYHDSKSSIHLYQLVTRGQSVNNMVQKLCFTIGPMVIDLALAASVLYYLFDAYMALDVAAISVLFMWSSSKILDTQAKKRREFVASTTKEFTHLGETTANWYTVSYFNRISYEKSRYSSRIGDQLASRRQHTLWVYLQESVQSLLLLLGLAIACFMAVYQVIQGTKPIGNFVMLLSYWSQLASPLQTMATGFGSLAMDMIDMEELLELLEKKPTVTNCAHAKPMCLDRGDIEFVGVNFSYDGKREVLDNVNFKVEAGQTAALVGQTGSGKTTILQMLNRFYDPTSGSVKIGGQDISQVTLESLRANIGVVPQSPALFNDTIMENIRYARLGATDEEIVEACKDVALHDRILTFTDGYQTKVGERGQNLSGGELQRVAIARAIIKNPKIVLLDEATSSVDSVTEAHVQESLKCLGEGRTTFIVAHRLSSVIHVDKIMVVKDGKIVEEGKHAELLSKKGHYYRLWSFQGEFDIPVENQAGSPIDALENGENSLVRDDSDAAAISPEGTTATSGNWVDQRIDMTNEQALGPLSQTNSNCANGLSTRNPTSKKIWKPDAPEFVPRGYQASVTTTLPVTPPQATGAIHSFSHNGHIIGETYRPSNIGGKANGDGDFHGAYKENVPPLANDPEVSSTESGDKGAKSLSRKMTMTLGQGGVRQESTEAISSPVVLPRDVQRRREMTKSEPTDIGKSANQNADGSKPLLDLEAAVPATQHRGQSRTVNQRRRRRYYNWSNNENRRQEANKANTLGTAPSS
ncbi:hypothetical protein GX51_06762 [Blastomyces parvus]|uniref:ATP-binding cassette, subfamily B (MDR/TAP), member 6 n=1 Tax=Blastomyces parvus TaxID=2060905 RepID=A0A2B7WPT0_9EURO|nr:hypothetical protein GX51_06762 [Blastomyces parvus]